ncbi:unnamed protein product [Rhodiola kirilowii]
MDGKKTKISDLPSNIIECILARLPIRDAVATSVLCKEWRHKWTRIPNLVFDNEFVNNLISFQYSNIIDKIMLRHIGPIHKFVLHIPSICNNLDLLSWMHFISQKEVKELTIHARSAQIKLPSYIFNCHELQSFEIHVRVLDFHPPLDFVGFCNLRRLAMLGLLDGTQISNLISKCPLLERFVVNCVADGCTLVIDAPRLVNLRTDCLLTTFLKLKNVQNLIGITLGFGPLGTKKFCELFDIFGSLPNVREVILINLRTINDMPRDAPTSLPTTLHNHSRLTLHNLGISSPQCICFILCIFKSSPNLRKLNIRIHPSAYISEEDALQLLDMKIKEPQTLNSLLTVTIKGLLGSRVEIMFIKLILSSTPVLETMYLTGNIVKEAEFTLMSELLKCKRPSPQAQTTEMGSKQIETDSSLPEPDRISDLPSDINSFILDRLSIREAVATSILSKDWRHKWRRIGNLIFDEEFLADVISPSMEGDDERMDLEYNNIVRRILLLHLGPVRKVVLFIPYFAHTFPCEFLSSWMPFISRTEVKELIIENHHSLEFRLPSDIFHCNELQHLKLNVWTLDLLPPQDFGGFCNLISLDLRVSGDEGVIGNLISKCPLLERLSLDCTACKQPLVIDAPRLLFLNVCIGMDLYMFHRMNFFGLRPCFGVDVMYFSNLISIFGSVPKVETVILTLPPTLAVFDMPPDAPMSLPTTLYNHKSLTLLRVDISSPECIYFVLCVLKSSPNLQMLNLGVIDIVPSDTSEDEAALHFLGLQTRKIKALKSLLTVKIKGLLESKTGVMFIKMILSCSPVLKTMYLTGNDSTFLYSRSGEEIRNEAEFALMPELL